MWTPLLMRRPGEVLKKIFCEIGNIESLDLSVNYKGLLQRWCLQYYNCLPHYEIVNQEESPEFYRVEVKIEDESIAEGEGKNKKKGRAGGGSESFRDFK